MSADEWVPEKYPPRTQPFVTIDRGPLSERSKLSDRGLVDFRRVCDQMGILYHSSGTIRELGMCGRVRLGTDFAQIRIELQFDETAPLPNMAASWNVCPTDPMLVAINASGKRIPQQMRWGLVPWWAKDIKVGFSSINARAETIDTTVHFAMP